MNANLKREQLLFMYTSALERGDMATVFEVLTAAMADPTLGDMIAEIDAIYANDPTLKEAHASHIPTPTPHPVNIVTKPTELTHPTPKGWHRGRKTRRATANIPLLVATTIAVLAFVSLILAANNGITEDALTEISTVTNYPIITAANVANLDVVDRVGRGTAFDVAWSPDGTQIALASATGIYVIDDFNTYSERNITPGRTPITALTYRADGETLIGITDSGISAWDTSTGEATPLIDGKFYNFIAEQNANALISTQCPGFDVLFGFCPALEVVRVNLTTEAVTIIQSGQIQTITHDATLGLVATATTEAITLWDVSSETTEMLTTIDISAGEITVDALRFDPTTSTIIALTRRDLSDRVEDPRTNGVLQTAGDLRVWDVESGQLRDSMTIIAPIQGTLAIDADGQPTYFEMIRNFRDGSPQLATFDMADDTLLGNNDRTDIFRITAATLSPTGDILVTILDNGSVQIWSPDDADLLRNLDQFRNAVDEIAFSPTDTVVAVGDTTTLDVWNYVEDDRRFSVLFPDNTRLTIADGDTNSGFAFDDDGQLIFADRSIDAASIGTWTESTGPAAERVGLLSLAGADQVITDATGAIIAYFEEDQQLVRQDTITSDYQVISLGAEAGLGAQFSDDGFVVAQQVCLSVDAEMGICNSFGVRFFDTFSGQVLAEFATAPFTSQLVSELDFRLDSSGRSRIAISACANAACDGQYQISVFDVTDLLSGDTDTPEELAVFNGFGSIDLSPDGELLAVLQLDQLRVVDIDRAQIILERALPVSGSGLAFAPDGSLIGVGTAGAVTLYGVPLE